MTSMSGSWNLNPGLSDSRTHVFVNIPFCLLVNSCCSFKVTLVIQHKGNLQFPLDKCIHLWARKIKLEILTLPITKLLTDRAGISIDSFWPLIWGLEKSYFQSKFVMLVFWLKGWESKPPIIEIVAYNFITGLCR